MLEKIVVYVALGGNQGAPKLVLSKALERIGSHPAIVALRVSHFYETTPVSGIKQDNYINAVCSFSTDLELAPLWHFLQEVEKELGKTPKSKEAPRPIDLDLLFYGAESYNEEGLVIPHPRWRERLFVLVPLAELTPRLILEGKTIDLQKILTDFSNVNDEVVTMIS